MIVARTIADCRTARATLGPTVGLVPTMGALHAGHLSLVERAKNEAKRVAVSIFVNPTQFGPSEDFSRYPRPIEKDLAMCREAGVDLVFLPTPQEMYPENEPTTVVDVPHLTGTLEGAHRPGHFRGVCQVVCKLFCIVQPSLACFGEKDFQQLRVIEAMTDGLNLPVRIVPCPTLREPDGLAMSSRNAYLTADERTRAASIAAALRAASAEVAGGQTDAAAIVEGVSRRLVAADLAIDYVALVDARSLLPLGRVDRAAALAVAVRCGRTRLIDNVRLSP